MIRIDSYEHLLADVADNMDICEELLEEFIADNPELDNDNIDQFINENGYQEIDEVYFCHLSRYIELPAKLLPLKEVLTTNNSFSRFLSDFGLTFEKYGDEILVSKDQFQIPKECFMGNELLARRLGYMSLNDNDGIDGFLFGFGLPKEENGYYNHLDNAPEFLQSLSDYLHMGIDKAYVSRSKYYIVYSKVSLTNGLLEDESLPKCDLTKVYLRCCIQYLYQWFRTYTDKHCVLQNPLVYVKEKECYKIEGYEELA